MEKVSEARQYSAMLRVKATCIDGKTNEALIRFLSKVFRTTRSTIKIIREQHGTNNW